MALVPHSLDFLVVQTMRRGLAIFSVLGVQGKS